jgi:hypothetical protein
MPITLRFVLAALAVWRVAFLLAREDGPGKLLKRLRNGTRSLLPGCVKCVSVWIAIPFAFFVSGFWIERFVSWLALAGVAALIDELSRSPFEWKETQNSE